MVVVTRPPSQVDVPSFPDVEQRLGDNPAKWLLNCRRNGGVTPTVQSLLDGMESLERLDGWIEVERQLGPAVFLLEALAARRRELLADRGDSPADAPVQPAQPQDESTSERSASTTPDLEDTISETDSETSETEFWGTVDDALTITRAFDEAECREYLAAEQEGKRREAVLKALRQRLADVESGTPEEAGEISETSEVLSRAV